MNLEMKEKIGMLEAGLPDISLYNIPRRGKILQIATKYTKWP
jgi:hypothetical protein